MSAAPQIFRQPGTYNGRDRRFSGRDGRRVCRVEGICRREGTKAAAMKDQVPDQIKAARSTELLELNRKKQAVYEERLLGTTQEVLIEEKIVRDGEELQIGHTKEYVKIGVKNPNNLINQLVNVEIENQLQILH